MRRLKIFTWQIHGSYLYYLAQVPHDIFVPFNAERSGSYVGLGNSFRWPANLHELPLESVPKESFDCVLYQHQDNWENDREILSAEQLQLPAIYLQHDAPIDHPTDCRHWVDDPQVMLVHVTHFNDLMWNSGRTPTRVIEHGIIPPADANYLGTNERGVVVLNHLRRRGRTCGFDIFERVRAEIPLDYIGMGFEELQGVGEFHHRELFFEMAKYRFFFNPIRWTSLPLSVLEAMSIGVPVVCLATTELATVISDRVNGISGTNISALIAGMRELVRDPGLARTLGAAGRATYLDRFSIDRFVHDWDELFREVTDMYRSPIRTSVTQVLQPDALPDGSTSSSNKFQLGV